ncbi:Mss4-like protein [Mucidula mucida]|nr:Mss4-like protein [Mucidula mucida]
MSAEPTQQLPPGLAEALSGGSGRSKPPMRSLHAFENGVDDVTITGDQPDLISNKYQLLCPREECRSVILRERVASFKAGPSVQIEPENVPNHSLLPAMPAASESTSWWLIEPSPMEFENIGFSRAVGALPNTRFPGKKLKLLICAECDLGPFGWCEEGGQKFWLACSRVGYKYVE